MSRYCFDTDVLSAVVSREPPLHLLRRLATVPPSEQSTTAITVGEMLYGCTRRGSPALTARVRSLLEATLEIVPFDRRAAERYGELRATLERQGRRLDEPDLRIASIVLSRELVLVTGNVRHFERVPDLRVENWLAT